MNDTSIPSATLTSTLVSVEDIALPHARPYAALGIGSGLSVIGIAGLTVYLGWPDIVVYLIAITGLFSIIGGIIANGRQDDQRQALAKAAIVATPTDVLAHATLDFSLSEKTRIMIVNHLNAVDPGWHARLDSENEDWKTLKAAGSNMTGCFRSCGSCK